MDKFLNRPSLKQQILSGAFWSAGGQAGMAAVRFGVMLVLARLLSADLFGLLGLSLVVMLILSDVSDLGFAAALVQRENIDEIDLATVFWFNLVVSIFLALFLFLAAGYLAHELGDFRLETILKVLSILLPIDALTVVPQAVMRRELKFAQLSMRDFAGMIGFGLVGIPMALANLGMWSLVGALAAQWVFRAVLLWLASPYRPILKFDANRMFAMSGFSTWMFASLLASRVMANLDYFLIGRFLGASALGYYALGFNLVIVPSQRITGVLTSVMFPSFSRLQGNPTRLQNGFIRTMRYLALILAPTAAFLAVSASVLVPLLYSSKWLPSVPVVQLLALASAFYGLDVMNSVLNAIGKPNWRVAVLVLRAVIFVLLAMIFGLARGIEGVAASILFAVAASSILQIWILAKELQITIYTIWHTIRAPWLSALLVVALGWWLKILLRNQADITQAGALFAFMGASYAALVLPGYMKDLRELAQALGLRRPGFAIKPDVNS